MQHEIPSLRIVSPAIASESELAPVRIDYRPVPWVGLVNANKVRYLEHIPPEKCIFGKPPYVQRDR